MYGTTVSFTTELGTGLRFLLGLAEAGLYPGVVFYMSWYVLTFVWSMEYDFTNLIAGINELNLALESQYFSRLPQ